MVGGRVLETIILSDRVWINCIDGHDECAIYVKKSSEACTISPGDHVWWQSGYAYWTPTPTENLKSKEITGPTDVRLERIGFSGVSRPSVSTA